MTADRHLVLPFLAAFLPTTKPEKSIADNITAAGVFRGAPSRSKRGCSPKPSRCVNWRKESLPSPNINLREAQGAGINFARELLHCYGVPSLFVSGQIVEARRNRDAALGYIGKPWSSKSLLESVKVAQCLIDGRDPAVVPPELELFGWSKVRPDSVSS